MSSSIAFSKVSLAVLKQGSLIQHPQLLYHKVFQNPFSVHSPKRIISIRIMASFCLEVRYGNSDESEKLSYVIIQESNI